MKVAIIGCGYVGSAVANLWTEFKGFDVLVTTTSPERVDSLRQLASQVEVVKTQERDRMIEVLSDRDVVLLSVASKRGLSSYEETYLGTARSMAAVLPQTPVKQLIHLSSISVYGQHHGAWVTEDMPPKPMSENGEILLEAERILHEVRSPERSICTLRLGGIYGPGRTLEKIYGRLAGQTRPGSGEEAANWVHLNDIVVGIEWARSHQLSGIYNLVQEEVISRRELIGRVCDRYQLASVTWDENQPNPRNKNVRVSNAKIKATGYEFVHPDFDLSNES